MGTCKTCQYWDQGTCDAVLQSSNYPRFELIVEVADDYNLQYELKTGPNFGCLHHRDAE